MDVLFFSLSDFTQIMLFFCTGQLNINAIIANLGSFERAHQDGSNETGLDQIRYELVVFTAEGPPEAGRRPTRSFAWKNVRGYIYIYICPSTGLGQTNFARRKLGPGLKESLKKTKLCPRCGACSL